MPFYLNGFRLAVLAVALACAFLLMGLRLCQLQLADPYNYRVVGEELRRTLRVRDARRGDILDAKGNLLASTRPYITVGVDPMAFDEEDSAKLPQLAALLQVPLYEVRRRVAEKFFFDEEGKPTRPRRWHVLSKKVDDITYEKVQTLEVSGVYGNRKYERYYPSGQLAAHVLGYIGYADWTETEGREALTGVERMMDYYLKGTDGWLEGELDPRRREMPRFRSREVAPTDGYNVELTIDSVVQSFVEREIEDVAAEFTPKSISIIVSEVGTGAVLALANYPTFDPNQVGRSPVGNLRNGAISDIYEPGSTFKIVAASAALEERLVGLDTVFQCDLSRVRFMGRSIPLPRDDHPHDRLTVEEIVFKSSNRGSAQLGMLLGEQGMYDWAKAFGYGEPSRSGLPKETSGLLHEVKDWDGWMISRVPMGHAVSATAMQVHGAMSVIANRGVLMQPMLVRRVVDRNGEVIREFEPHERRQVLSEEVARSMAAVLAKVTQPGGTAKRAAIEGYATAGKTGTTKMLIDGRYSSQHHVGSFTGFFPAENPRVIITVKVEDPQLDGAGYGGLVAAPSFRRIGERMAAYYGIEPSAGANTEVTATRW